MSIYPNQWGPYLWYALHYVSLGYPNNPTDEDKQIYKNYYTSYATVLPCSICANHYKENLKKVPLTDEVLSKRENLIAWVINLHNEVNVMKQKEALPFNEARQMVESYRNDCIHKSKFKEGFSNTEESNNTLTYLVIAFISFVFIAVMYKKK